MSTALTIRRDTGLVDLHERPMYRTVELGAGTMKAPRSTRAKGVPGYESYGYGGTTDPVEWHSSWQDPQTAVKRIHKMLRRDSTVGAAMELRVKPLELATVTYKPPGTAKKPATDLELEATDWVNEVMVEDAFFPHSRLVSIIATCIPFGFSWTEGEFFRLDDRWRPACWHYRSQYSIVEASQPWVFDDRGQVVGANQTESAIVNGIRPQAMELRDCIHATYGVSGRPEGESPLRGVERDEFLVDFGLKRWGIAVEKWASPQAVVSLEKDTAVTDVQAWVQQGLDMAERVRTNEGGGVSLFPGQRLDVVGASDGDRVQAERLVQAGIEGIARRLHVPFLVLGSGGNGGAYALGDTFIDTFMQVVQADGNLIEDALGTLVNRLVVANFGAEVRTPTPEFGNMREMSSLALADKFTAMAQAGIIKPTEADEAHWRAKVGAPPAPAAEVRGDEEGGVTATEVSAGDAQKAGLNGAQVTAMVDVARAVAAGEISGEVGQAIIAASYPVSGKQAARIAGTPAKDVPEKDAPKAGPSSSGGDGTPTPKTGDTPPEDVETGDSDDTDAPDDTELSAAVSHAAATGVDVSPTEGALLRDGTSATPPAPVAAVSLTGGEPTAAPSIEPRDRVGEAVEAATGWRPRRPLRDCEKCINFAALDGSLNDGVRRITEETHAIRQRAGAELLEQVEAALGDPERAVSRVDSIKVPAATRKELAAAILAELREAHRTGRKSVAEEMRRQKAQAKHAATLSAVTVDDPAAYVTLLTTLADADGVALVAADQAPHAKANADRLLAMQAKGIADDILGEMESVARGGLRDVLTTGRLLGDVPPEVLRSLADALSDRSLRGVSAKATGAVPMALGFGRRQAIEQEAEKTAEDYRVFHSALLDAATCPACEEAEGYTESNVVLVGSAEQDHLQPPLSPNPLISSGHDGGCDGGRMMGANRCRCIHSYELYDGEDA